MPTLDQYNKLHGGNGRSEWLFVRKGEYKFRIASSQFEAWPTHYVDKKTHTCYGKQNGCPHDVEKEFPVKDEDGKPVLQVDGKTPVTEKKTVHNPGVKMLLWVIDRADGKVKVCVLPKSIMDKVVQLKSSKEYGFDKIPPYDVIVTGEGEGRDRKYTIIPARTDTPLTDAEKEELKNLGNLEEIIERKKAKELKNDSAGLYTPSAEKNVEDVTDEEI